MRPQRLRFYISSLFIKLNRPFYIALTCALFCLSLYLYHLCKHSNDLPLEIIHYQKLLRRNGSSTGKCDVPRLDPWHPTILKYFSKIDSLGCSSLQKDITALQNGILRILDDYRNEVTCRCRTFEHNEGESDFKVKYDDWMDVDPVKGLKIPKEFVEVECYSKGLIPVKIYNYHWSQIVKEEKSVVTKRPFGKASIDRPSVVMFGLDSMSRSNFIRTLPKTHQQFQSMGFVDMLGHVKVADNTYQNWMAILTGKRSAPTREFKGELPDDWYIYFDGWPLVWNNFSNADYVTLFAEDRPDIATFNYFGKLYGFKHRPVDHYFRPYWLEIYWNLLKMRSAPYCYDKIPTHLLQLHYLKEFVKTYQGTRSFAYCWSQDLSHDYLNQVGVADNDFASFFRDFDKYFENTILIMFSDHGHRYDSIRETVIGRLESRLPYLSIRLPKKFTAKFPHVLEALKENSQQLTTQFDLHETLLDITGGFERQVMDLRPQRGYSLLRKMPKHRKCFEANVPEDYCPCFDEIEISEAEGQEPAEYLIDYVNRLLSGKIGRPEENKVKEGYKCLPLEIQKITFASVRLPPSALVKDPQVHDTVTSKGLELRYRVVIRAQKPSEALLEGIVIKNVETGEWSTTEEIERNNKYGNTSHCVVNPILKKICHCISSQ